MTERERTIGVESEVLGVRHTDTVSLLMVPSTLPVPYTSLEGRQLRTYRREIDYGLLQTDNET